MATVTDWDSIADDVLGSVTVPPSAPPPPKSQPETDWDALADSVLGPMQQQVAPDMGPVSPSSYYVFDKDDPARQRTLAALGIPQEPPVVRRGAEDLPRVYARGVTPPTPLPRGVQDTLTTTAKGLVGAGQAAVGLLDLVAPKGPAEIPPRLREQMGMAPEDTSILHKAAQNLAGAQEHLQYQYSPETQKAYANVSEAKGFLNKIGAALNNPSVIAASVAESIPSMLAGGLIGKGLGALGKAGSWLSKAGYAAGEGVVTAGSIQGQTLAESPTGSTTLQQKGLAVAGGALTGLISWLSGNVASKLGVDDIDKLLAGNVTKEVKQNVITRAIARALASDNIAERAAGKAAQVGIGATQEGFEELFQSYQEQIAGNLAQDKPWYEGLDEAAVMGLLTGGVMGGGTQMRPQPVSRTQAREMGVPDEILRKNADTRTEWVKNNLEYVAANILHARDRGDITPERAQELLAGLQLLTPKPAQQPVSQGEPTNAVQEQVPATSDVSGGPRVEETGGRGTVEESGQGVRPSGPEGGPAEEVQAEVAPPEGETVLGLGETPPTAPVTPPQVDPEKLKPRAEYGGASQQDVDDAIVAVYLGRGREMSPRSPQTDHENEIADFLRSRNRKFAFVDTDRPGIAGVWQPLPDNNGVILINGSYKGRGGDLWFVVGHELAHQSGLDAVLPSDSDLMRERRAQVLQRSPEDLRKEYQDNPELLDKEVRADFVGEFLRDANFRAELQRTNPTLWQKLRDLVLRLIGQWTPQNEARRKVLEELRLSPVATEAQTQQAEKAPKPPRKVTGLAVPKPDTDVEELNAILGMQEESPAEPVTEQPLPPPPSAAPIPQPEPALPPMTEEERRTEAMAAGIEPVGEPDASALAPIPLPPEKIPVKGVKKPAAKKATKTEEPAAAEPPQARTEAPTPAEKVAGVLSDWEKTQSEYVGEDKAVLAAEQAMEEATGRKAAKNAEGMWRRRLKEAQTRHRAIVADALRQKFPVADKILADYPDLQEAYPAPTPAETAPAKEPWQMTRAEVEREAAESFTPTLNRPIRANRTKLTAIERRQHIDNAVDSHYDAVEKALSEGKPVPPEVLADYPDLQPKAEQEPTKPASEPTAEEPAASADFNKGDSVSYRANNQNWTGTVVEMARVPGKVLVKNEAGNVDMVAVKDLKKTPVTPSPSAEAPAPAWQRPEFQRETTKDEETRNRWRQAASLENDKARQIRADKERLEKQLQGTRRNAHKKRAALQGEIREKERALGDIEKAQRPYKDDLEIARIEDSMETAPSEVHWLERAMRREDLLARRRGMGPSADKHRKESERLYHNLRAEVGREVNRVATDLDKDERQRLTDFVTQYSARRMADSDTLSALIEKAIPEVTKTRIESELEWFREPNQYGRYEYSPKPRLEYLTPEQRAEYREKLKSSATGSGWKQAVASVMEEAKTEDARLEKVAEAKRKADAEEAAKKAAEAERERVAAARERSQRLAKETRFWKALSEEVRGVKTTKGTVKKAITEDTGEKDVKGKPITKTRRETVPAEILPDGVWAIIENWNKTDSKERQEEVDRYSLTHINTGLSADSSNSRPKLMEAWAMIAKSGVDFSAVKTEKDMTPEMGKAVRAFKDAGMERFLGSLEESDQARLLKDFGAKPTDIKADVMLDQSDFEERGPAVGMLEIVQDLVKEVPEFSYNPVFTVRLKNGAPRLVYRDGYKFELPPEKFGLVGSDLKEGQTIGLNLDDMGIARNTAQDVVRKVLNDAFHRVTARKGRIEVSEGTSVVKATMTSAEAKEAKKNQVWKTVYVTGEGEEWSVEPGGNKALAERVQGVLNKIRWQQPSQPAEASQPQPPKASMMEIRDDEIGPKSREFDRNEITEEQRRASRSVWEKSWEDVTGKPYTEPSPVEVAQSDSTAKESQPTSPEVPAKRKIRRRVKGITEEQRKASRSVWEKSFEDVTGKPYTDTPAEEIPPQPPKASMMEIRDDATGPKSREFDGLTKKQVEALGNLFARTEKSFDQSIALMQKTWEDKWKEEWRPGLKELWDEKHPVQAEVIPEKHPEQIAEEAILPSDDDLTGIKKAVVNELRALAGLPEMENPTRQEIDDWVERARATLAADPTAALRLVNDLASNRARPINEEDAMLLQFRYRQLANELEPAILDFSAAVKSEDPAAIAIARSKLQNARSAMTEFEEIIHPSKSTWGRTGVALQLMMRKDFSTPGILRRAKEANNGEALSRKQVEELTKLGEQLKDLQKRFDELQKKYDEQARELASNEQHQEVQEEVKKARRQPKSATRQAAEKRLSDAWAKLKSLLPTSALRVEKASMMATEEGETPSKKAPEGKGTASAADLFNNYVEVAQAFISLNQGNVRYGEFLAHVRNHLATLDEAMLRKAWDQAAAAEQLVVPEIDITNLDMANRAALTKEARAIQRRLVEAGMNDRDEVLNAVHEILSEDMPELTKRQTTDALSRYGQWSQPSQEDIDVLLRRWNAELLKLSQIDQQEIALKRVEELRKEGKSDEEIGDILQQEKLLVEATGYIPDRPDPNDPDDPGKVVRDLTKQYNQNKKGIPATSEGRAGLLQTALSSIERGLLNRIQDLNYEIKNGPIVREKRERPTSERIKELEAERDRLLAIHREMFPPKKKQLTEAQRIANAIKAAERTEALLKQQLQTREFDTPERQKLSSPELDAIRARIEHLRAQREALKELELSQWESEGGAAGEDPGASRARKIYEASLKRRIAEYKQILASGDFSPKPKKAPRELSPSELKLKREMEDVRAEVLKKFAEYHLAHLHGIAKLADKAAELANLSRALMTAFDLSALLNQGGLVSMSNPLLAQRALTTTIASILRSFDKSALFNTENFQWSNIGQFLSGIDTRQAEFDFMHKLMSGPNGELKLRAGLAIANSEEAAVKQEEMFQGRWGKYIPGISLSGRLYTMILNKLRSDLFDLMVDNLGRNGQVNMDEAQLIATFVNAATGRSSLGKYHWGSFHVDFDKGATWLNLVFFAPRFVASRFQYLAMPFYLPFKSGLTKNWQVKRAIYREYAKTTLGIGLVLGTISMYASLFGGGDDDDDTPTIETDTTSSDFWKPRFGDTRIDLTAGLTQIFVLASQIGWQQTKNTTTGKIHKLNDPKDINSKTAADLIERFARGKAAPVPGAIWTMFSGMKNVVGEKETAASLATGLVTPLSTRDVAKRMTMHGLPMSTALNVLAILGLRMNTYGPKTEFVTGTADERAEMIRKDLKRMTVKEHELPAYSEFLTPSQLARFRNRQEELMLRPPRAPRAKTNP